MNKSKALVNTYRVTTHSHAIFEVSVYLRKYDAAVSSYRSKVMKTHSYLPCEELRTGLRYLKRCSPGERLQYLKGKTMRWQYRTIVFEFQKDGLLGDRFIDDEGVETTLNEQGRAGWELVSATMIQDGLLTLLKRPEQGQETEVEVVRGEGSEYAPSVVSSALTGQEAQTSVSLQQQEREHIQALERQRKQTMEQQERCLVGEIRIR